MDEPLTPKNRGGNGWVDAEIALPEFDDRCGPRDVLTASIFMLEGTWHIDLMCWYEGKWMFGDGESVDGFAVRYWQYLPPDPIEKCPHDMGISNLDKARLKRWINESFWEEP